MEQLLANIEFAVRKYRLGILAAKVAKEEINIRSRSYKEMPHVFREKFFTVRQQIMLYRDLIDSILTKVDIDVCIEHEKGTSFICYSGCDYENYVLLAIVNRKKDLSLRFKNCDFLAFCGDPETKHINVYEYKEVVTENEVHENHFRRRKDFKDHAQHLADDHIDKFNIEEMTPYIERYISNELNNIVLRSSI